MSGQSEVITTAHGAGGDRMRALIQELILPRFDGARAGSGADAEGGPHSPGLSALDDGAVLPMGNGEAVVLTTDSHVVTPTEFPGGDIGRLAVSGTVNDLAVMGATEGLSLTCSLIVEEGVSLDRVESILDSMAETCEAADCRIVTGDTKVMGSGELDAIAINTAGVGRVPADGFVTDRGMRPGDRIVVSGTLGDHGIALLAAREDFDFGEELMSDVAPVNDLVAAAMDAGTVTAMKDPTRGGFASAINEMAAKADLGVTVEEAALPVTPSVASAGEILGIDPIQVANEGKVVMAVDSDDAEAVLDAMQARPGGEDAAIVGEVTEDHPGRVVLETGFGRRYLSVLEGDPLPRIC